VFVYLFIAIKFTTDKST